VTAVGTVTLLYFAWVREKVGVGTEQVELDRPMTVGALIEGLAGLSGGHGAALADRGRLRAAVNQDFVGWDAVVQPGDEVAIFPPVTGG
jgi:molybdopterin synthase sulfur carrier subunit